MSIFTLLLFLLCFAFGFALGVVLGIKDCKFQFDIPKGARSGENLGNNLISIDMEA